MSKYTRYKPLGWRGEPHKHSLAAKGISTKYYASKGKFMQNRLPSQEENSLSMTKFLDEVKNPESQEEEDSEYYSIASQNITSERDRFYAAKLSSMFKNEEGLKEKQSLRQQDIQRKRAEVISRLDASVDRGELTASNREFFVENEMASINKMFENGVMSKTDYDREMDRKLDNFLSVHSRKLKLFDFGGNEQ